MTETKMHWDLRVGNHLADLKFYADWMARHGRSIHRVIRLLPERPVWQSMARESLDEAERELRVALAVVKAAQDHYDQLPTKLEAAE